MCVPLFLCPLFMLAMASPISHQGLDHPIICNNGTEYQCICMQIEAVEPQTTNTPKNDQLPPKCDQFVQKYYCENRINLHLELAEIFYAKQFDQECPKRAKIDPDNGTWPNCLPENNSARELPVVDMRLRHVNLETELHTKEKYETYFKRRIANIVSAYCEHQANECPGTTLRLDKEDLLREDTILYGRDDTDPLLTQDNVILLSVEMQPGNVTRIQFAISKNDAFGVLNEDAVIDPVKIKYILGSQAGPLSRILGGIKIDSVRVGRIKRTLNPEETDNSKLLLIIYIVAAFFIICYIIGAIRIYRDCVKRRRERKKTEADALITSVNNYGTCKESSEGVESQKKTVITTNGEVPVTQNGYDKIDEKVESTDVFEEQPLDARHARLMFACDLSQLPRESFEEELYRGIPHHRGPVNTDVFDMNDMSDLNDTNDIKESTSPIMEITPPPPTTSPRDDYYYHPTSESTSSPNQMVEAEVHEEHMEKQETTEKESDTGGGVMQIPVGQGDSGVAAIEVIDVKVEEPKEDHTDVKPSVVLPTLVLQASNSMCDSALDDSSGPQSSGSGDHEGLGLLTLDEPFERPASRRGSRVDEIDIDEILDLRERCLSGGTASIPAPDSAVHTDGSHREKEELEWSSSDEEVDVYYKMSEDEVEGDDWTALKSEKQKDLPKNHISIRNEDSESEEEEEEKREEPPAEELGYVYERLREDLSPRPVSPRPHQITVTGSDDDDDLR